MNNTVPKLNHFASLIVYDHRLEKRSQKKLNDVNDFKNSNINAKEMITYFKDQNPKSKTQFENYKTLASILEAVHTVFYNAATTNSAILTVAGVRLVVIPLSSAVSYALSLCYLVIQKKTLKRYDKYKKQKEKDHKTIKSFDDFFREILRGKKRNLYKVEWVSPIIIFTKLKFLVIEQNTLKNIEPRTVL